MKLLPSLLADLKAVCAAFPDPRKGLVGRQFGIVAEHGQKAAYVRNIIDNPRVRLKLREGMRARWHTGTARVLPDDDPRERQRWLAKEVPGSASNAAAVRFFGTQLLTIRIDLDD